MPRVATLQQELNIPEVTPKAHFEVFINNLEPYFRGAFLYRVCLHLCCNQLDCTQGPEAQARGAVDGGIWPGIANAGFLFARVYLTGFGVVTSLYSAMLFNGWIGVVAGLIIELWREKLGRRGSGGFRWIFDFSCGA